MSLLDAVVLHEQVFYLPALLPDDVSGLELRALLVEGGAIAELPAREDHDLIGKSLVSTLSTVAGYRRVAGGPGDMGTPLSFEDFRANLINELTGKDQESWHPSIAIPESSFDAAARSLIGWMDYGASGAYEESVTSLRAMYYVFASEHYGLPYLPSISQRAVQYDFPNYFQPSVREKLYGRLATSLETSLERIKQEFEGDISYIPPFSALALHRASRPEGIAAEIIALRAEHADFRAKMSDLERERSEAKSLDARLKIIKKIELLGKEVASPFDRLAQIKIEPALRYIPNVVDIVTNPTNPSGWANVLLNMPVSALVAWYRRRPVAKLTQTAIAVANLSDYGSLLEKHFGEGATADALEVQEVVGR